MTKMRTAISASGEQIVKVLGVTAPVPMETWQSNLTYRKLNIVRNSNGSTYIAKKDNTGIEPGITNGWEDVWQYILSDPQTAVESAQNYAKQAQESATSAVTAANNAQNSATNAATSETNASESATNAATSATQAANSANSIANSVNNLQSQIDGIYTVLNATVTNEVTVSEAYTSRETASGLDIIDGALTQVESIQGDTIACDNMFGYEEDTTFSWNGLTINYKAETGIWTINGQTISTNGYTVNNLSEIYSAYSMNFEFLGGTISGGSFKIRLMDDNQTTYTYVSNEVNYSNYVNSNNNDIKRISFVTTTSGVTFNNYQFRCMVQKGTIAQQDMKFQPYFTGLKNSFFSSITSTGKNVYDISVEETGKVANGCSYTVSGENITITPTGTTNDVFLGDVNLYTNAIKNCFPVEENTTYTFNCNYSIPENSSIKCIVGFLNTNTQTISNPSSISSFPYTFTTPAGTNRLTLRFGVLFSTTPTASDTATFSNIIVNAGESALPYQPYTTDTLSVSTPIELTKYDTAYPADNKVVRGGKIITLNGSEGWAPSAEYEGYFLKLSDAQRGVEYISSSSYVAKNSSTYLYCTDLSKFSTLQEWKNYLAENNIEVCYPLSNSIDETVVFNKFFYKAYSGGMEYITQGATDNSEYGAECNVTQIYIEQKGGTQS